MSKKKPYRSDAELPSHIADMPQRQRDKMSLERSRGSFDGKAHLKKSPIGRAAKKGFPVPVR